MDLHTKHLFGSETFFNNIKYHKIQISRDVPGLKPARLEIRLEHICYNFFIMLELLNCFHEDSIPATLLLLYISLIFLGRTNTLKKLKYYKIIK